MVFVEEIICDLSLLCDRSINFYLARDCVSLPFLILNVFIWFTCIVRIGDVQLFPRMVLFVALETK
jgi:hypothetical protein